MLVFVLEVLNPNVLQNTSSATFLQQETLLSIIARQQAPQAPRPAPSTSMQAYQNAMSPANFFGGAEPADVSFIKKIWRKSHLGMIAKSICFQHERASQMVIQALLQQLSTMNITAAQVRLSSTRFSSSLNVPSVYHLVLPRSSRLLLCRSSRSLRHSRRCSSTTRGRLFRSGNCSYPFLRNI